MKNKILIKIYFLQLDDTFELYIPINKNIANIIELICKAISEMKNIEKIDYNNLALYNHDTSIIYSPDIIIKNSNIKNGTRLILM